MVRIANSVLLMLALIGAGFAWNASPAYIAASRENSRLTATVGQFAVDDQNRFHVVSVPTGNRLEWKWFVYIPANCGYALKSASRVGGDSYVRKMTDEEYGVIRVRMRNVEGTWYLWYSGLGGSARRSISATLMEDVDQFRIQAEPSQVTSFWVDSMSGAYMRTDGTYDAEKKAFTLRGKVYDENGQLGLSRMQNPAEPSHSSGLPCRIRPRRRSRSHSCSKRWGC